MVNPAVLKFRLKAQRLCALGLLSLGALFGGADAPAQESWSNLTLYEPPLERYRFWRDPSMNQAADLTLLTYHSWSSLNHYWRNTKFRGDELSPMVLELGLWAFVLPEPMVWLRNEWQRELLREQGIDSASEAYYFWSENERFETSVTGVSDAELNALQANSPANFTRLGTARYEAAHTLNGHLSEDNFFSGPAPRHRVTKAYLVLADLFSLYRCRSDDFDLTPDDEEQRQDITGLDCRHWAYELFAPEQTPGVGTSQRPRYLAYDDLNEDAQSYLKQAYYFSFLNLIDTHFFDETNSVESNRLSFQPTPFGRAFGWHHLRLHNGLKLGLDLYWQQNADLNLPAGRLSLVDYPIGSALLTGRVARWRQPEGLQFQAAEYDSGWAIETSISQPLFARLRAQADWYYKTVGWYPGYRSLNEGSGWRFGVDVQLF